MSTHVSTKRKRSCSSIPCSLCNKPRKYSSYKDLCVNCALKIKQQKLPLKKCECRNPDCKEMIPIMTVNGKPMKFAKGHNDKGNYKEEYPTPDGYVYTHTKNKTRKYKYGLIRKHRLVYEEYYNCCLLPWIDIHHINGNKIDNRIENLEPLTRSDHNRKHNPRISSYKPNSSRPRINSNDNICSICNSNKTYIDKRYDRPMWYRDDKDGVLCGKCFRKARKLIKRLIWLSFSSHSLY